MPRLIAQTIAAVARVWTRFNELVDARAEREIAAWGAALQYRRRYTNPDTAKLYRRNP